MIFRRRRRDRRRVDPRTDEIVKFFPSEPPRSGETVLVNGERFRVVRANVRWSGLTWFLDDVLVEPIDAP